MIDAASSPLAFGSRGFADEARRLCALAWPVMLSSLNWTLLHLTDIFVVGMTGTHQVAVFGASRTLTYIAVMVQIGALTGILVRVSQAAGAGDLRGTGDGLRQGLLLALVLALVVAVPCFLFAVPMLRGIGVTPTLVPEAAVVVRIMALAIPFQLIFIATANFLEGISRPRRVTAINLTILPINGLLAWALATGQWGLAPMGAEGAAWATFVSLALGAAAMLLSVLAMSDAADRGLRRWRLRDVGQALPGVWRLARFGFIPAIASGLELAGFSWLIALSTQLGDVTAHAFQIIFSLHNFSFGAAVGFASAAGVRVGNAVGEGAWRDARRRTLIAATLALLSMLLFVLAYLCAPRAITGIFPAGAAVHDLAAGMLMLWAPFILFDGVQVVATFALRSLNDQAAAGVINIVAFFVVTGIGGAWLVSAGYGATGLVLASGGGMLVAALLNGARFWWRSTRPVVSNDEG